MRMKLLTVLAVAQMSVTSVLAQPLAECVPDDALLYVGWRGIDSMGPGYDGSHFQQVLETSGAGDLFDQFVPQLVARIAREDPESAEQVQLAAEVGRLMWRCPTAFYVGALDIAGDTEPAPRVGLICQAGDAADELAAKLNRLIDEDGAPGPIRIERHGDRLVVTLGARMAGLHDLAKDPGAAGALAHNASFKAALAQVHGDPVVIAYANVQGILDQIDEIMVVANPMVAMFWPQINEALGTDGLRGAVWTGGFDGADWDQRLFLHAPAPRAGLLAMMAPDPVTDDIFKVVPQSAAMVSVARADLSGVIAHLRTGLGEFNPDFAERFDAIKQQFTAMLGVDVDVELLQALGPQWAVYTDRNVAGAGVLGIVLVNPLRDADAVERSLTTLGQLATTMVAQKMQGEEFAIAIRQTHVGDMTIHYVATPAVAPAWGIKDGNLYVGLYPQVVAAAAQYVADGGPNLLANPDFRAMRERLGDVPASSVSFVDLPQTAPQGYQMVMLMSRLYLGLADMAGAPAPPMLLPTLPQLMPHLGPAGSISWVDDQGYHVRAISPFPGSQVLGTQNSQGVAQVPMLVGIMLPALSAARRTAKQMQSNTQARGIHQGCILYAQGHNGQFPTDIGILLVDGYFTVDYTISPMSGKTVPRGFDSWADADKRQWVNENTSYVLVPGLREDSDTETIVVFTKLQDSGGKGISICWNDNHVTFEPLPQAEQLILAQTGKSLQQWSNMGGEPAAQPAAPREPSSPPPAPR